MASGSAHRILVIDGDPAAADALGHKLKHAGFAVATLAGGEDAFEAVDRFDPHLVMLDWDMPGVVTLSLIRHASQRSGPTKPPRFMALSSYSSEQQIVAGLNHGLDDYVVKPYSVPEVMARVRALLRPLRVHEEPRDFLEFKSLRLDLADTRAHVRNRRVHLRTTEFRLLEFLVRHAERAFSREQLLSRVWGRDCAAEARAVDVTVQRVRRALDAEDWGGYLQTVRGVGYRLSASPERG